MKLQICAEIEGQFLLKNKVEAKLYPYYFEILKKDSKYFICITKPVTDYMDYAPKLYVKDGIVHMEATKPEIYKDMEEWLYYIEAMGAFNFEVAKIHIDENCIVGWATSFYKAVPTARKEDFLGDDAGKHKTIGEIRKPTHFSEYIYPYQGQTNIKFNYLMDRLNDTLQKKNLGAFYTPPAYAEKSLELVRMAISRVPAGNDFRLLSLTACCVIFL